MFLKNLLCCVIFTNCYSAYAVINNEEKTSLKQTTNESHNLNDLIYTKNIVNKKTVFKGSYAEIKQELIDSHKIITDMDLYIKESSDFPLGDRSNLQDILEYIAYYQPLVTHLEINEYFKDSDYIQHKIIFKERDSLFEAQGTLEDLTELLNIFSKQKPKITYLFLHITEPKNNLPIKSYSGYLTIKLQNIFPNLTQLKIYDEKELYINAPDFFPKEDIYCLLAKKRINGNIITAKKSFKLIKNGEDTKYKFSDFLE